MKRVFNRTMKLSLLLATLAVVNVFAADEVNLLASKVTLNINNRTVKEVLKEIEKQSNFIFFYNDLAIDMERKVQVNVKNKEVREVLASILP
ncbi:MAG: hypothetical protein LBR50_05570, partial [Tannerella sp.]|nr:hypothetical protein [Tannerella sp.]